MGWVRRVAGSAVLLVWLVSAAAAADLGQLLRDGERKFRAGDLVGAEASFAAAVAAAPDDGRGHVLRGYALAQLKRYREAVDSLRRARALGITQTRLLFELGRAAAETGDWTTAREALGAYEAQRPGLGVVSLLRGRAELGAGNLAMAEAQLNEALRRDPRYANAAGVHLARVAAARGDAVGAEQRLAQIRGELDRALQGDAARPAAAVRAPARPWSLSLSAGAGYNDNVIGLANGQPLPRDISRQGAAILEQQLQASYGFRLDPSSTLNFSYGLAATESLGLARFNQVDNQLTADYARRLTDQIGIAVRVGGGHVLVGGDSFRSAIGTRLSAAYRWSDASVTELAYAYSYNTFHDTPLVPALDRDGHSQGVAVTQLFALDGGARVLIGLGLGRNQTRGSEFDSNGGSVLGAFSVPIALRLGGLEFELRAQLAGTLAVENFDNPSAFTLATPAGAVRRQDTVARLSSGLILPVRRGVELYLGHTYTHNGSNVSVFDYDQHVASGGLTVRF